MEVDKEEEVEEGEEEGEEEEGEEEEKEEEEVEEKEEEEGEDEEEEKESKEEVAGHKAVGKSRKEMRRNISSHNSIHNISNVAMAIQRKPDYFGIVNNDTIPVICFRCRFIQDNGSRTSRALGIARPSDTWRH